MKNKLRTLVAVCGATLLLVGAGGSPAHAPAYYLTNRPAALPDTLSAMYEVGGSGGVRVIQRRATTSEVVAVRVYLLGGSRQITSANAGIEPLVLEASEYGTVAFPGVAARQAVSRTGSVILVGATPDWTTLSFVGLAEDFDSTWTVFADRLMRPTLDSAAIAIARNRLIARASSQSDLPEQLAAQMAESLAYQGHPYATPVEGTVASLNNLTPAVLRDYLTANLVTSRLLVVVVGNVTRAQVEAAVGRTLATLPHGTYKWTLPERWQPKATAVVVRSQTLPTNYIYGYFSGPSAASGDAAGLRLGLSLMSGFIFGPMRDSGLTYAAGSGYVDHGASGGVITASTSNPERALKIINNAIEYLTQEAKLRPEALGSMASGYLKDYALSSETSEAKVDILGSSYLYHGDYAYQENYASTLRQLSPETVNRTLRNYIQHIQWAYVGDTTKVPRQLMMKY